MSGPVATFAPQQAQPSALQAPQNPSNEDPLLVALREYITTGPDASNITTKELQAIYNDSVADATSKSHLETYLTTTSSPPAATWEASAIMSGNITITKASFHFDVSAPTEVAINIKGDAAGVFSPWTGPVNGTFWYNNSDDLAAGSGTFRMQKRGLQWWVGFFINQVFVGCFVVDSVPFYMDPRERQGTFILT